MNSSQLKMVALCWFRFTKRWNHIATEVGAFNADVIGANEKYLYEIEVKISMRDFRADFQKAKHNMYESVSARGWKQAWVPNKFFFIVPEDLVPDALDVLKKYPKYGLLTVDWKNWYRSPEIKTVKQAKFLHRNPTSPKALDLILHRMSSEICGHYIKNEAENNKQDYMLKLVKKLVKVERKRK